MPTSHSDTICSMDITIGIDDNLVPPLPTEAEADAPGFASHQLVLADLEQRELERSWISGELARSTIIKAANIDIDIDIDNNNNPPSSISEGKSPATTINVVSSTGPSSVVDDTPEVVQKKDEEVGGVGELYLKQAEEFPDGGMRAWLCVLGTWFCLFSAFGLMNAIGVFQAYYKAYLLPQYTDSQLSWIMGFYLFFIFAGGVFAGTIFDIYGPTHLIIGGTICVPFGMALVSVSEEYWHLILAQSVIAGCGTAMTFYASIGSVATWFYHKRAMAIGVASTGGGVGGIFFPLVMSRLLPKIGFAWTTRFFGLVYFITLIVACLLVRSRLSHPRSLKARRIVLFDFAAFREPAWSFFGAGCFVQLLGLWGPINYLASFALANGFSTQMALYMIAFLNAGGIVGRALPGILGDRFGRITMFVVFSTMSGVLILAMWSHLHTQAGIIAFAVLYGFSSGAFVSMYAACVAQLTKNVTVIGQRLGTLNVLTAISSLVSLPISGSLVKGDDFTPLIWFAGVMILAGSLLLTAARYYAGERKWRVIV